MALLYNKTINVLRRNLFDPCYYALINSDRVNYWKEIENTQFLTENELYNIQWRRLISMLYFVSENNSFYKNRLKNVGIAVSDITCPADLRKIPILTKGEIQHNSEGILSSGYKSSRLLKMKTGGSTGKALEIYITEECSEKRNACARRHDRWAGWEVGEPIAAVWGNPHISANIKDKLKNWLISPITYLDTMNVNEESVRNFGKEWRRVKPTLLFGHAHSIYILAQLVQSLNIGNIKPQGILSTSMTLVPHERKVIEEVFGVKVIDRYGCEEVSLIASECEKHEGMHLNIEHLYIEFLREDGTPARLGEPGRIIVTDLMNRAMPFIRYEVEDVGVPTGRKCSCGRGLPLMDSVSGRMADFLRKKDGTRVAGISLIENTLTKYPGIDQMQIVQNTCDYFIIRIVPGQGYDENVLTNLENYFKEIFGPTITIQFEVILRILPSISGKYRFSICNIK